MKLVDGAGTELATEGASAVATVQAPEDDHAAADIMVPESVGVVIVEGGTAVSRSVVAERVRLGGRHISVIVEDDIDDSAAATLILSGRADAVARTERQHAGR